MRQDQIGLINKFDVMLEPVIEDAMVKGGMSVADIVYCATSSAESRALAVKRHNKLEEK